MSRRGGRVAAVVAGTLALAVSGTAVQASQAAGGTVAPAGVRAAAAGTVITTTDASFGNDVLRSGVPVLVVFCAEWSGPCRMLKTPAAETARDYSGRATVAWHDIDRYPDTHPRYNVTAIPTLHLFKGGRVTATRIGPASKSDIADFLSRNGV
ncbi:co-chaperone YbbN [Streptomyces sp. 35G-GA-8]|uniref:thioredoxin family protein n=1 Tax=Streptomyces sp. 35G-GA-8 TaxID=2939434 RepID=UPI00201F179C|nr:thioredoxin domain-containing protein [Streptomyces sp. 35G-GA-8]MCL7380339.1 thioredoxin domain-containing protein [Streptomyces sp. 35G-GA-8]